MGLVGWLVGFESVNIAPRRLMFCCGVVYSGHWPLDNSILMAIGWGKEFCKSVVEIYLFEDNDTKICLKLTVQRLGLGLVGK